MFNTKLFRLLDINCYRNLKLCNLTKTICDTQFFKFSTQVAEKPKVYKSFEDLLKTYKENSHAHSIMHSISSYSNTLYKQTLILTNVEETQFYELLNKHWRSETGTNIVNGFITACKYSKENNIPLTNPCFDKLVDGLMDRCQDLTDDELLDLLACIREYPPPETIQSHNFHDIWSALDDICFSRHLKWNVEKLLLFCDHWYLLGLCRYSDFIKASIQRLERKLKSLTPSQLVQTLFIINTCRKPWDMFEFECRLEKHIDKLSIDELGIVSMSFFKTQKPIKGTFLLSNMIYKLLEETKSVNEITLTAILKVIRFSPHLPLVDILQQLLNKLVLEVDRLSILCCVHIALVGTNAQFCHPEILTKISEKFVTDISKTRLKDLERLTFALTLYNLEPKTSRPIYEEVLKELLNPRREPEIQKYSRCFSSLVQYLTLKQIYNYDLINRVLDFNFLMKAYGDNRRSIGREILFIDTCMTLDCPDYKGHRLENKLQNQLTKWTVDWIPTREGKRLNAGEKLLLDISETMEKVQGGKNYVHINHILPHFPRPDIITCTDQNGNPIDINDFIEKNQTKPLGHILYPEYNGNNWYAVIAASWNSYIRGSVEPTGMLAMKIRQLKKIGYIPIMVPWLEFAHISQQEKETYIKNKLR